jgi:hypothetical protein
MRRGVGLAFAVVAIAGCASNSSQRTSPSSSSRPRTASSHAPSTTATTSARPPGCAHHPIAHDHASYYGLPAVGGRSIDYIRAHGDPPTNDGHGDMIRYVGTSLEKTGPDGTLTLTRTDGLVRFRGFGDFDGDGRSDLLIDTGANYDTYIVPGTDGRGTYDPARAGVRVPNLHIGPDRLFSGFPGPVGDQNGDGADDVGFGSSVYSGRQLVAGGAAAPAPLRRLASPYVGLLQVDPNAPPSFVVPDEKTRSVQALDHRSDQLLLDGNASDLPNAENAGAGATGWLVNGHHIVEYRYSTRSGATQWRWDLDAACGT